MEEKSITEEMMKELKTFKKKMKEKYGIKEMLIFGSAARDEMGKDSDIDIIIISDDFKGISPLKRPVKFYMEWDLPYPVDFICYTPEEFERLKNRPSIVRDAIENGFVV